MITLEHKTTKQRIVKSNKDADVILKGAMGSKYRVVQSDKQPDPPETKVSIKNKK